jgi:hypothetical protein
VIRVSRGIIRLVKSMGGDFDDYRYYVIVRHHFAMRSGVFSLDELCDLLHSEYGYASLHHRPGNDRRRHKRRLAAILAGSVLFSLLPDGRYKVNAEKSLLSKYGKGSRNGWYLLSDATILTSRRRFFDFCVGTLLSGNKFRANKNIASYCGCSVRRVQYATSRNHKEYLFTKQYNFVEEFSGPYEEVLRFRAVLLNVHGITSPLPSRYKGEWVLRLNAPNSYRSNVLSGVKGDRAYQARQAQPTVRPSRKEECWFVPVREKKDRQLKLFKDPECGKRWFFNTRVYDVNRYVQDHSRFL